jgi:hypothetical protein
VTWKGYKWNYRHPFWDISTFACREPQQPKNQSMQLAPQLIQSTNADQYISVLHATVSLCTAYTLCSVGMCKSACSTHTVKQWLVHITFLILGHQTLWWRQTNPPKWLTKLCYGLLVWVHLFVMRASNVIQREKRYAVTFCAYPGKTGLYTYPLQLYYCTLTDWFWQFTYEGWSYVLLPTPTMNKSTVKVI